MPLLQQDFDFPQGADLTGVRSLKFTMDPEIFPDATVVSWRLIFRVGYSTTVAALNRTGTGTVSGGKLLVPLAASVTAAVAVGGYRWDFWADSLDIPIAGGRVTVGPPKITS